MIPRSNRLFSLAAGLGSLLGIGRRSYGRPGPDPFMDDALKKLVDSPPLPTLSSNSTGLTRKQRKQLEQDLKRAGARSARDQRLDCIVVQAWEAKARKVRAGHSSHKWIHPATPSEVALRAQR